MPIFQFKCDSCSAIFEQLVSSLDFKNIACVNCEAESIARVDMTYFYPNKVFCPHDKVLDTNKLRVELGGIQNNTSQRCGGCGTDGSPGKCSTKGGGCLSGSQGCGGGCSCKKSGGGCSSSSKLTLEI